MNILNRLTISQKIYLIPIIGAISFIVYLALSTITSNSNVSLLSDLKDVQFPVVQYSKEAAVSIVRVSEILNSAVTTGEEDAIETADTLAGEIKSLISKIGNSALLFNSDKQQLTREFQNYYDKAKALSLGIINETIDFEQLPELGRSMNSSYEKVTNTIQRFNQSRVQEFENAIIEANDSADNIVTIGFIMGAVNISLLFGTAIPIISGIKLSLLRVIDSLRNIADGDLTVRLKARSQDEIGELVTCFNRFIEKLQLTIKKVVDIAIPLSNTATTSAQRQKKQTQ